MNNKRIICIKGDVGSGKTTLINNVAETLQNEPYSFTDKTAEIIDKIKLDIDPPGDRDCWLLLRNGEHVIIVQSEGDYVKSFYNTESYLDIADCNNITVLCALRTGDDYKTPLLQKKLDKIQNKYALQCEYIELSDCSNQEQSQEHTLQTITKWVNI